MRFGGKGISIARFSNKTISTIRYGVKLVWQAVRSCFGSGWWVNEKPWVNDEGWKN